MENFGNIKDTFKNIIIESVIKKDNNGKKLFTKFIKTLKENKSLRDQYLIYKNLQSKKFDDVSIAKEYIKENINLLKRINKKDINEVTNNLLKILKGKKIIKENDQFYSLISFLTNTKKTPSNIDKINESYNKLVEFMVSNKNEDEKINVGVDIPPSVLTKLMVNKFNEKYSDLNESDKNFVRSILNGNKKEKEGVFNNLKKECIELIDGRLSESTDLDLKDKLLKVKDRLLNTNFDTDKFNDDIVKIYNLKETINN